MVEQDVKSTRCPCCKTPLDAASSLSGDERPKRNDFTICLECGGWLRFTRDLDVRKVTTEEIVRMPRSQMLALARVSLVCRMLRRKN